MDHTDPHDNLSADDRPAPASSSLPPQTPAQNLYSDNQLLSDYLDRIESLWVRLQKRSAADLLPIDQVALFLTEVERLFPVVLSAVYRVDATTQEFTFERCVPAALQGDIQDEAQRQIAQGHFALALWHRQPTLHASLGLHRYHPRVRTILLVPLLTRQEVYNVTFVAITRAEQDITPHELKLLAIQAGQTALALENAQHAAALQRQKGILEQLEQKVRARTTEPARTDQQVSESPRVAARAADTRQPSQPAVRPAEPASAHPPVAEARQGGAGIAAAKRLLKPFRVSPRAAILSLLVTALVVLSFVWYRVERNLLSQRTAEPPSSEHVAPPQPPTVPQGDEQPAGPTAPEIAASPQVPMEPPVPAPPIAALPPLPSPPPPEPPPATAPHQLSIQATEEAWIRVTIDGAHTKDVLLQPGERVEWSAQKGFLLIVGNAGGVQLTLDGEQLPPLGASGRVVRNLQLPPPERQKEKGEKVKKEAEGAGSSGQSRLSP
ncbi:MAG: DUF4115 domain-containing protein [Deltaproteobacteria bacterium]|nr:DUF4115 domain-containing protein [Deltaproteobacteria bacterium]